MTKENKIAVDIVLIPSRDIVDLAILLNSESKSYPKLNAKSPIPHISLSMGCIKENLLPELYNRLSEISKKFKPLELLITHIEGRFPGLIIEESSELLKIHNEVTDQSEDLFSYDGELSALANARLVDNLEKTMKWINNFPNHIRENFEPHITFSDSSPAEMPNFPIRFTTGTLSVYHIGTLCTCEVLLKQYELE